VEYFVRVPVELIDQVDFGNSSEILASAMKGASSS